MSALETLIDVWKMYSGFSPLYLAVPAAMVLFLCDKKNRGRKYVFLVIVLLALLVFNPYVFALVTKVVGYSSYRMFWMFPSYAALAYIVWFCAVRIRNDGIRLLLVLAVCAVLLFKGAVLPANASGHRVFELPPNKYQIENDTVYLAEEMLKIMDERGLDEAYILSNQTFAYSLRPYSARFLLRLAPRALSDRNLEEHANEPYYALTDQLTGKTPVMEPADAERYLEYYGIYFVVVRNDLTASFDYLEDLGWTPAASGSTFTAFCKE